MSAKEQPKRLGRGLAALLGEAAAPTTVNAPGVQRLPVDVLEPSPYQPRQEMDETALGELADSIAQRGFCNRCWCGRIRRRPSSIRLSQGSAGGGRHSG